MEDLVSRIQLSIEQHMAAGAAYERCGDSATAARARGVANLLGAILNGMTPTHTVVPDITPADEAGVREHWKRIHTAEFHFEQTSKDYSEDFDAQLGFDEGAGLTIKTILSLPPEARPHAMVGAEKALAYLKEQSNGQAGRLP